MRELAERHTRQTELAVVAARTAGQIATRDHPARRGVAREFLQFQTGSGAIFIRNIWIVRFVTQFRAVTAILFSQHLTALVFIDRTQLSHAFPFPELREFKDLKLSAFVVKCPVLLLRFKRLQVQYKRFGGGAAGADPLHFEGEGTREPASEFDFLQRGSHAAAE